jgi:hypothetical protein
MRESLAAVTAFVSLRPARLPMASENEPSNDIGGLDPLLDHTRTKSVEP